MANHPAVCRRVDSFTAPTAEQTKSFGITIEKCVDCEASIYVSAVTRERTTAWHCDRCAPAWVQSTVRFLGVRNG